MNKLNESYKILGLPETASVEDVKQAYRKLSKKFHPDVNEGDQFFEQKFKELNEAYNYILANQDKSEHSTHSEPEITKKENDFKRNTAQTADNVAKKGQNSFSHILLTLTPVFIVVSLLAVVYFYSRYDNNSDKSTNSEEVLKEVTTQSYGESNTSSYNINSENYNSQKYIPEIKKKVFYYIEIIISEPYIETIIEGGYKESSVPGLPGRYEEPFKIYRTKKKLVTSKIQESNDLSVDDEYQAIDNFEEIVKIEKFSYLLPCKICPGEPSGEPEKPKIVSRKLHKFYSYMEASKHKRNNEIKVE